MTPPKSLMTAVGVKNKPSAIIFRLSSMLIKITNTYSPIWNREHGCDNISPIMHLLACSFGHLFICFSYLQCGDMHDPGEGWFEHHGDAGADGYYNHNPVQIGDKAQKIAAGTHTHWCSWSLLEFIQRNNIFCVSRSRKLFGLQTSKYSEIIQEKERGQREWWCEEMYQKVRVKKSLRVYVWADQPVLHQVVSKNTPRHQQYLVQRTASHFNNQILCSAELQSGCIIGEIYFTALNFTFFIPYHSLGEV